MLPHLTRLLSFTSVVLWLFLGSSRALVVCVESDGRVQIEVASVGCCDADTASQRAEHDGEESHEGDECSDCDDLTFVAVPSTRQVASEGAQAGALCYTLPPLVDALAHAPRSRSWMTRSSPSEPPRHIGILRSTLLRC